MSDYHDTNPTAEEINAVLGDGWTIARKTNDNCRRYGRCITKKEYDNARKEALRRRGK